MARQLDRRLAAVMFTDMVGYTALIQADEQLAVDCRDAYMSAVERHHAAVGGTIVQRLGDGSMSMFPSSLAAVQAAVEIQRELSAQDIPVRIGVHVGEVIVEPERLTGNAVNIASRIESFAVPGGVMLSDDVCDQLQNRTDVAVVSLGRFRLKNVGRPMELFAVSADGIVVPDPHELEGKGERFASLPNNLPEPAAPLLGRSGDVASLIEAVKEHPVVTVTGPGGVGKTRILVELGRLLAPDFLDGVAFVAMADVADPEEFLPALADTLDVKEAEGRTLGEGIVSLIGDKRALLLLDNLEQVVSAAPDVAWLAEGCPGLRIVTTSRTPLRIAAEQQYALAPLALPSIATDSTEELLAAPAVAMFVDRARATKASFQVTPENAAAVAGICRRLDGLPLALELAAARLRLLSPAALLERLDHALAVLTTGARDTPSRHRTLRATIDWSYSLLSESEQKLFRRMAVFAGGCTLADAEAVCADPGESTLDELESLDDKALIQVDGRTDRLRMLQTIGEYAREQLEESGESEAVTRRFVTRYAAIAHDIRDGIEGVDQVGSLHRAVEEDANILSALETLLAMAVAGDASATQEGLQMCGDLYMCWHIRGKNLTARDYATAFLDADRSGRPTVARSGALISAGLGSFALGHLGRADEQWAEAHRVAERVGAGREMCVAAFSRAFVLIAMGDDAAGRWAKDALERSRALGSPWVLGFSLTVHGLVSAGIGDTETAEAEYLEALSIQEDLGDLEGAGLTLGFLAALCASRGERPRALDMYRRAVTGYETIGDRAEEARMHDEMAWTHLLNDDSAKARHHFLASARAYTDVASVRGVGLALIGLAAAEAVENRPQRAVQLVAAAEVYAHQEGIVNVYSDETPGREYLDRASAVLSEEDVARATEMGRRLTITQALDLARIPVVAAG